MNLAEDFRLSSKVMPLTGVSHEEVASAVASGVTIPMWNYTNTSTRDGRPYAGMMVGASPFTSPGSTTAISASIIAIAFEMPDGGVFDPTAADPCLSAPLTNASDLTAIMQSPIFQNHAYTMNGVDVGVTQYADAFQRANFWSAIGGQPYQTFNASVLSTVTVQVGSDADLCARCKRATCQAQPRP